VARAAAEWDTLPAECCTHTGNPRVWACSEKEALQGFIVDAVQLPFYIASSKAPHRVSRVAEKQLVGLHASWHDQQARKEPTSSLTLTLCDTGPGPSSRLSAAVCWSHPTHGAESRGPQVHAHTPCKRSISICFCFQVPALSHPLAPCTLPVGPTVQLFDRKGLMPCTGRLPDGHWCPRAAPKCTSLTTDWRLSGTLHQTLRSGMQACVCTLRNGAMFHM
jgi:hypothetical protein